jgi:D-alanine-D-alanine ligase
MLIANNLRTPKFKVFEKHLNEAQPPPINLELAYPLIVKPIREDGSIGIKRDAVVDSWKQLTHQVNAIISRYHQPALVEEFIDGRELNVGIVGYDENLILLPISEIIFNLPEGERNFVSYEAKWHCHSVYDLGTTPKCPAELDINLEHKLTALAKRAYRLMDIHDYGRIDFRVDNSSGEPYILEVNPNPDLSRDAGLARMAQAMGMTYENLIEWIIESAISRCLRK